MYIDFKESTWTRIRIPEEHKEEVIKLLKSGEITDMADLERRLSFDMWKYTESTDGSTNYIPITENGGFPTMEVWEEYSRPDLYLGLAEKEVWDNVQQVYDDSTE